MTMRWHKWADGSEDHPAEPFWAYTALVTMIASFLSLGLHFCFFLGGTVSGIGLISMIIFAALTEAIFIYRKQWWWFWYWTICVLFGVGLFEVISYFFGGKL